MTARVSPATEPFPADVQAWLTRTMPPGMAPAAALVAEASSLPVLTTPDSAVAKLKKMLGG